mgnify:CR=1 FL=1
MQKLGFLFGAGAEICYGLPTGGKFALDIFRQDISTVSYTHLTLPTNREV